jgi:hypothetical protein
MAKINKKNSEISEIFSAAKNGVRVKRNISPLIKEKNCC